VGLLITKERNNAESISEKIKIGATTWLSRVLSSSFSSVLARRTETLFGPPCRVGQKIARNFRRTRLLDAQRYSRT